MLALPTLLSKGDFLIAPMSGAVPVGVLLMPLSFMAGTGLLLWWGWRLWHLRRGQPRPPLRIWQWVLAVWLSILLFSTLLGLVQMVWSDHCQAQQLSRLQRLTHITLERPMAWGDITLPAGSHIQRDMPQGSADGTDGQPDLRGLQEIRFPHPVPLGDIWVNALSVHHQVLLELALPHSFTGPVPRTVRCEPGNMLQLSPVERPTSFDRNLFPRRLNGLVLADWVFDACFVTTPIGVRYWKGGRLVWAVEPLYEPAETGQGRAP